jgi:hypothetical protein
VLVLPGQRRRSMRQTSAALIGAPMPHGQSAADRRLVYVRAADMDQFQCRPFPTIDVLDLQDRPAGNLDGIVIDRQQNLPIYLVVTGRRGGHQERQNWFLVPVGDAWFDDTQRAVRIDVPKRERIPFDPDEFGRMTHEQAEEYERRVLAACCPEVGFHRDGRPNYARLDQFKCPVWLRSPAG